MGQSLFRACKNIIRDRTSGAQIIGNNNINIEYYTQSDIDKNVLDISRGTSTACTFGDDDESKIVLVASKELTIPSGFELTPADHKIALILIADTLTINGTVSMNGKSPESSDYLFSVVSTSDGYSEDINTTDSGNLIIICNKLINNSVITPENTRDLYLIYNQFTNTGTIGSCRKTVSTNGTLYSTWTMPDLFREQKKKFSETNWAYLFGEYINRFNEEE